MRRIDKFKLFNYCKLYNNNREGPKSYKTYNIQRELW